MKKELRNGEIQEIILCCIAAAGILAVAVCAPNAMQALRPFMRDKKYSTKRYIDKSLLSMRRRGLVRTEKRNGVLYYVLSQKGKRHFTRLQVRYLEVRKKKKWNGEWMIVSFDISSKWKRDIFRDFLIKNGWKKIHQSFWISPYGFSSDIKKVKKLLLLHKDVCIVKTRKIDQEEYFKQIFKL